MPAVILVASYVTVYLLSLLERYLAFHILDSITAFSRTLVDFFQEKSLFFEDTVTRGTHGDLVHFKWMSHRKLE